LLVESPLRAIREQIAGALDLVVQLDRFVDGSRRVVSISEVVGMEGDIVTMQELLHFRQHGLDEHGSVIGNFESTGVQPICLSRFAERGIRFDLHEFQPSRLEVPVWATR
jgi:pilus assembly protein CpaF